MVVVTDHLDQRAVGESDLGRAGLGGCEQNPNMLVLQPQVSWFVTNAMQKKLKF